MERVEVATAQAWAERQFGECQLGDWRRTERAVKMGVAMREAPGKPIPQQMRSPKDTKAAYRFLGDEAYQYADLIQPHWAHTRAAANRPEVVLLVQDLTELDYTKLDFIHWKSRNCGN